jgi:hypothetical protein
MILKKFEKEIVFDSSVLAWIRIRIEQKCWIRIRVKSIRIHNPDLWFPDASFGSINRYQNDWENDYTVNKMKNYLAQKGAGSRIRKN